MAGAGGDPSPVGDVCDEAARLHARLVAARAVLTTASASSSGLGPGSGPGSSGPAGGAVRRADTDDGVRVDRLDDPDALRAHLAPGADRVARLTVLADALASGGMGDDDVATAVEAVIAEQPVRNPR